MLTLRVDHHVHSCAPQSCGSLAGLVARITAIEALIMTTQTELADGIRAVTATVDKIAGETRSLLDKVSALDAALAAAGTVTTEVEAAMAALQAQVAVVDALVPDVPVDPAPVDPTPVDPAPVDPAPVDPEQPQP